MVGERQPDGSFNGTMARILKLGNFVAKDYLVEGDMTQADENLLNNKLFGYGYHESVADLQQKTRLGGANREVSGKLLA